MATVNDILTIPMAAAADLSAKQFYFCKVSAADTVNLAGDGELVLGVLTNAPASGAQADIQVVGVGKVTAGAAVAAGAKIASNASGQAVTAAIGDEVIGIALEAASASGVVFKFLITRIEGSSALSQSMTAAADLSAKQNYLVKVTAANTVNLAGNGELAIGSLINAPAAAATAHVQVVGVASVSAGAAVAAGAQVAADANGQGVTATTGEKVIGIALNAAAAQDDVLSVLLTHVDEDAA
jgi:hypothetical protein